MVIKIHFIEEFDLCEWETYNGDTEDVKLSVDFGIGIK